MNSEPSLPSLPFQSIVVTSPDSEAAEAALNGPLKHSSLPLIFRDEENGHLRRDINIYSTSDPFGTRMGSGGGTLAALDVADRNSEGSNPTEKQNETCQSVLIIHAGGQSSRCPTQMSLGKAWTSLPTSNDTLTNPTYILMESLSKVLANLPKGSVVVAASDVLLSLPMQNPINFDQCDDNKVLGLAVPAALETAKNHGVFVTSGHCHSTEHVCPINAFLQKPSVEHMINFPAGNCVFQRPESKTEMAWIDTGVIIFLPGAAKALRSMIQQDLKICTKAGLEKLFKTSNKELGLSMQQFAKGQTFKVELYSHLLLSIPTGGGNKLMEENQRLSEYMNDPMNQDLNPTLLQYIYNKFQNLELQVCIVPEGQFIHLGTTGELRDFMINGTSTDIIKENESEHNSNCRNFGKRIGLSQQSRVLHHGVLIQPSCVALNSTFIGHTLDISSSIGNDTVVEHCRIKGRFSIGSNCIVSGIRGDLKDHLAIPNGFVCQLIRLKHQWRQILNIECDESNQSEEYVCIFHHINDSIKSHDNCFGIPFQQLLNETNLTVSDVWNEDDVKKLLWDAQINPVISKMADGVLDLSILSWINNIHQTKERNDTSYRNSLDNWKSAKKLSLSQLRSVTDASFELSYRDKCQSEIVMAKKLQDVLNMRSNMEIDLSSKVFDDTISFSTLKVLDEIIVSSIGDGSIDISCRAFMLISTILDTMAESLETDTTILLTAQSSKWTDIKADVEKLQLSGEEKVCACKRIICHRDELLINSPTKGDLIECSRIFEEAAFALIQSCVSPGVEVTDVPALVAPGTWVNVEGKILRDR